MKKELIICNKKMSELNRMCYPEERMPIKATKDIKDLGFREHITMDKYIKSRQINRGCVENPYNYNDIHEYLVKYVYGSNKEKYADEYLDHFKKLEKKLLSIGGYEVVFTDDCEFYELKKILSRGQFLDGRKFKKTQGEPGRCHENSILGWEANKDKAIVMSGYALSDDGYWVHHSWLINVKNNSQPLETTPIKRYAYFGYALNLDECNEFLLYY